MNAHRSIQAEQAPDANARFLAACDLILANLRTPLQRYKKVAAHPATLAHAADFMKMERAKDAFDASDALDKQFIHVNTFSDSRIHHSSVFDRADERRALSKRIAKFREQLSAKMEREDAAFMADGEPDYFTTPRSAAGMGG